MRALTYPFNLNGRNSIGSTTNYNQIIRGQVIDALMTNLGERKMRPRYGCDVQSAVFDPTDELVRRDAAGLLKKRLEDLVPRAIIRNVSIDTVGPEVTISVVYRATPYSDDVDVVIPVVSEYIVRQTAIEGTP